MYWIPCLSFVDFLQCPLSSVHPSLDAGKIRVNILGTCPRHLLDHSRVPVSVFSVKITVSEPLKRAIGRIFRISKKISEKQVKSSQLSTTTESYWTILKTIYAHRKILKALQKISILWHNPLKGWLIYLDLFYSLPILRGGFSFVEYVLP